LCRNGVRWVFRLERSYSWESHHAVPEDMLFFDRAGKLRLIVERTGRITVTRGYAWNGCSPKFCILDIVFGTPDGVVHARTGKPKAYYASLVHDALYQFLPHGAPLERHVADSIFLRLLAESDFRPRYVYWAAVWLLGGLVRRAKAWKRQTRGMGRRVAEFVEG